MPMPDSGHAVSRQTLYLSVLAALLIGFVVGVGYSAFRSAAQPAHARHHHPAHPAPAEAATVTPDMSVEELEKRAQADPDNARVWTDLAHAFHAGGKFEDAIAAYNRSLAVEPDDADVRTDMGVTHYQNKNPALAILTFEQVLHGEPKHAKARFNMGVVLYQGLGKKDKALEQWKALLQQEPEMRTPEGLALKDLVKQLEEEGRAAEAAAPEKPEAAAGRP